MSVQTIPLASVIEEAKPGFASGDDLDEGVFQIRMNNITRDGCLDLAKKRRVRLDGNKTEGMLVRSGDVIFNATNSPDLVGKSAYIGSLSEPTTFSNHFLRIRTNTNKLDGRYLARWLHTQFQSGRFKGLCRQWVNQATVSREALLGLEIPLPNLSAQRRIAAILDQADTLRAKRREALAQLDILAQSIFIEMFGDLSLNTHRYPITPLGQLCDVRDGTHDSPKFVDEGYPLITTKNLRNAQIDFSEAGFISEADYIGINKRSKVDKGDILMPMIGNPVLVDIEPMFAIKNVALIKFLDTSPDRQFILNFLKSDCFYKIVAKKNKGVTQKFLALGEIRALPIPIPAKITQDKFSAAMAEIHNHKEKLQVSVAELDSLFTSLQRSAFRGEL